jgi:hypothetical protein
MNVLYHQQAVGWPLARIEFGVPTWDHNPGERSVRVWSPNVNGGFNRAGSPEVPIWAVYEILEVALKQGAISPKRVLEIVTNSL